MQQSTCEVRFGVSGLRNPSLLEKLYPSDLPENWRLSYYINEFSLILVQLPDLGGHLSLTAGTSAIASGSWLSADGSWLKADGSSLSADGSAAMITERIIKFLDEIEGEDFILLFELSELTENIKKSFFQYLQHELLHRNMGEENLYFINLKDMRLEAIVEYPLTLHWGRVLEPPGIPEKVRAQGNSDDNSVCYVTETEIIKPVSLRKLIEHIREQATAEGVKTVNVIFSSAQNALENCRNAILLESLM